MTVLKIIILAVAMVAAITLRAAGIGQWRAYMAYHDIQDAVHGGNNTIYVLASNDLYAVNTADGSLTTYDKVNGLSDCGITHIAWNSTVKRLVIVYSDYNIDFMGSDGTVTNLSDYYTAGATTEKTVNSIFCYGRYAFLSTAFGILKIDVSKMLIDEAWNLGTAVQWAEVRNRRIIAYSQAEGQLSAPLDGVNLSDRNAWTRTGGYAAQQPREGHDELLKKAEEYVPGGPKYNTFGFMKFMYGALYTAGGGWTYNELDRPGTVQVLRDGNWQIYDDSIPARTGRSYVDVVTLDVDPADTAHVMAGSRTGLYEFRSGQFVKAWSNDNTGGVLKTAATVKDNSKNYVIVSSVKYDTRGNLWGFNSISPDNDPLFEYTADGTWRSFRHSELMALSDRALENVEDMTIDSRGLLWFGNNHYRSGFLYSYDTANDRLDAYTSVVNEDGTSLNPVYMQSIAEDRDNNIWIGTDKGPLMLTAQEIASAGKVFEQVKVPRNDGTNLADYLLSTANVTCIAVDGGGRKWFGTSGSGAYLIAEDNITTLAHFTQDSSPLLSDNVESIAINPKTGEVFFGTDKGLCSYMSEASEPAESMDKNSVWAYPNPVEPGYAGPITITGLTYNADVKIVTASGALVAEGQSTGGSFVWDGNDRKGKRVASGVYLVMTATADGKKGAVCKIAVVN